MPTPATNAEWECAQFTRTRYPDDWHEWPERFRLVSDRAIERLLEASPGSRVVREVSACMSSEHPRFPDDHFDGERFYLVRTVWLDPPASVSAAWF